MIQGQKLRTIRDERDVTQSAVAARMGISAARVSTIESGRRGPISPDTAKRYLAAVFDVGVEEVAMLVEVTAWVKGRKIEFEAESA